MELSGLSDLCDDVEEDENGETELGLQASGEWKRSELVGRGGFCIDYACQQCYIWFIHQINRAGSTQQFQSHRMTGTSIVCARGAICRRGVTTMIP